MNIKRYRFYLVLFLVAVLIYSAFSVYYFLEQENTKQDGMLVQNEYVNEYLVEEETA